MSVLVCTPKGLDPSMRFKAAENAININPLNRPQVERLLKIDSSIIDQHPYIGVLTSKRWHTNGVDLSVSFMEATPVELAKRIIFHMNSWGQTANIRFRQTNGIGQVRISREMGGYWSYLGTDILLIDSRQQTMNLQGFTMATQDSEFYRVVRHETGHTLGFPHEHMREELVNRLDRERTIQYFMATQGWSRQEVIQQVLTPIEESSLFGTPHADQHSIMCYQIPGQLTIDGLPIIGGTDINETDRNFASVCYPKHDH